jgi:FOG: WD40-like repeat
MTATQIVSSLRRWKNFPTGSNRRLASLNTFLAFGLAIVSFAVISGFADAQDEDDAPKNQLGELFRKIDEGIRRGGQDLLHQKQVRDQIDQRPLQRPEDHRRLEQARTLINQQKWNDAIELLQFLIEQDSDVFTITETREFRSVQNDADQLLSELPPEGRRNYVNRFGIKAQQLLNEAMSLQDERQLLKTASLYFHTPAGRSALQILARTWEDRGEFGRAADAWLRLLPEANERDQAPFQLKAIRNLARGGRVQEALTLSRSRPDANQLQHEIEQLQARTFSDSALTESLSPPQYAGYQAVSRPLVEPPLLPRWSLPLVERYGVRSQIEHLNEELRSRGRTLIPTLQPLGVKGKIAWKSLRSLQVRDLFTGQLVWERRFNGSPEELLSPGSTDAEFEFGMNRYSDESMIEHHPLTSLIYRDQVYGSLSSDGKRLFCLEISGESALSSPRQFWQMNMEEQLKLTPWSTNELTAYDLNTGLIHWRVGGVEIEEAFSRPLAGTRFLNAPACENGQLFLLGERHGEIILFCLSAQTGEEIWSQPLVSPGRSLKDDLVRAQWACQPVLADGLVLCPTGAGWIVAVDRNTHRLRWTARFTPRVDQPQHYRSGYAIQPLHELNRRWQSVTTMVADGKVLVTPLELPDELGLTQPMLYCFDLQTGATLWEQPKSDRAGGLGLYLAGVWNQQAIIVGTTGVIGRDLNQGGTVRWDVALPAPPSGRSVLANNQLLVPVQGGKIVEIDLKSATIRNTFHPATDNGEIGNLTLVDGQLVSSSYLQVTAFPVDGEPIQSETDLEALARAQLRDARMMLANRKLRELNSLLDIALNNKGLSPGLRDQFVQLRRSTLLLLLESQQDDTSRLLEQLKELSTTSQHHREYERTRIDVLIRARDFPAAVVACLDLLENASPDDRITDGPREVRVDGWVGGRLHQLFTANSDSSDREFLNAEITRRVKNLNDDSIRKDRWARALSFHPVGLKLELELAKLAWERGQQAEGLIRLSRVAGCNDPLLRLQATVRMAEWLEEIGWLSDALTYWSQLHQQGDVLLPDGRQLLETAAAGMNRTQAELGKRPPTPEMWGRRWTVERVGVSGSERQIEPIQVVGSGFDGIRSVRMQHEYENSRLRVFDRQSGQFLASFPLRSHPSLEHQSQVSARLLQSLALVMHRGVLHAVAWPDRKVLWAWDSGIRGSAIARFANVQINENFSLMPMTQFAISHQYQTRRNRVGYLLAANPRALLIRCNDWIAIDPITGAELWRDRTPTQRAYAQELGTDWFLTSGKNGRIVVSALNGQARDHDESNDEFGRVISVIDQDLIILNRTPNPNQPTPSAEIARITPSKQIVWQLAIPGDVQLGMPDGETIVWLTPENDLSLLDLNKGQVTRLGRIPISSDKNRHPVSVLSDRKRIYVLADSGDSQPMYANLPAIRFAGTILAFDRSGELQWSYETPFITPQPDLADLAPSSRSSRESKGKRRWPLNVLLQDLNEAPMMLLIGDSHDRRGDLYFHQLRVIGLDLATGHSLVDWERPSESGGFSDLHIDPELHLIELRSYSERLRMQARPINEETEPSE